MAETPGQDPFGGLAKGRESAFEALYDRHAARLFRAAWGMTGSREAAEDAVQDVFTGLLRTRIRLREVRNLPAYLFAALRHALIRRGSRRRERAAEDVEGIAGAIPVPPENAGPAGADRLEEALGRLPSDQREVMALKVDGSLTFAEIAEVLEISANTAASRYRYALARLRAILKGSEDDGRASP